ncbi:MAG: hypothetical protein MZU97_20320 [Bacillus subtilis]|nr:hypothetical protein [Bacillus subtilis]
MAPSSAPITIGLLAEYSGLPYRWIRLRLAASVSLSAIVLFPLRLRAEFKKIYNVEV